MILIVVCLLSPLRYKLLLYNMVSWVGFNLIHCQKTSFIPKTPNFVYIKLFCYYILFSLLSACLPIRFNAQKYLSLQMNVLFANSNLLSN